MVAMKRKLILHILCGLSVIILLACMSKSQQKYLNCQRIGDERLIDFPFLEPANTARIWIADQYGLSLDDLRSDFSEDRSQMLIRWSPTQDQTYSALLWNELRESASISITWHNQAPTLADTVQCLGDPPLYRAFQARHPEAIWTYLELWYPERGLLVSVSIPRKARSVSGSQPVVYVMYVLPGPVEDLVSRFFWPIDRGSERYFQILSSLKPWPGDIKQITVDISD